MITYGDYLGAGCRIPRCASPGTGRPDHVVAGDQGLNFAQGPVRMPCFCDWVKWQFG
jgi:hypothetical protein